MGEVEHNIFDIGEVLVVGVLMDFGRNSVHQLPDTM